jgi:hypothetical protein
LAGTSALTGTNALTGTGPETLRPLDEPTHEARANPARFFSLGESVVDDAALFLDAGRHEVVVGLERLCDETVCEVHDSVPFERPEIGFSTA